MIGWDDINALKNQLQAHILLGDPKGKGRGRVGPVQPNGNQRTPKTKYLEGFL